MKKWKEYKARRIYGTGTLISRFLKAWMSPLGGHLDRAINLVSKCDKCGLICDLVYIKCERSGIDSAYSDCCKSTFRYYEQQVETCDKCGLSGFKMAPVVNLPSRIKGEENSTIRLLHGDAEAYVVGGRAALAWIVLRNPRAAVRSLIDYHKNHTPNFLYEQAIRKIKIVRKRKNGGHKKAWRRRTRYDKY